MVGSGGRWRVSLQVVADPNSFDDVPQILPASSPPWQPATRLVLKHPAHTCLKTFPLAVCTGMLCLSSHVTCFPLSLKSLFHCEWDSPWTFFKITASPTPCTSELPILLPYVIFFIAIMTLYYIIYSGGVSLPLGKELPSVLFTAVLST